MAKLIDLTGQVFGRLTVLKRSKHNSSRGEAYWLCKCQCGARKPVCGVELRNGNTVSCGCYARERASIENRRHGFSRRIGGRSSEYITYDGMVQRCYNPKSTNYKNYGGKGIKVCQRWLKGKGRLSGFECFIQDMGKKPGAKYSIDRYPNTKGNYKPSNCRWATQRQQANNRSNNQRIEWKGKSYTLAQLARKFGIKYWWLHEKIVLKNWSVKKVLANVRN